LPHPKKNGLLGKTTFKTTLKMSVLTFCVLAVQLLVSGPAQARRKAIVAGARAGVTLPQISSELGAHFVGAIEAGYILPWLQGRLQVFGAAAYCQPEHTASGTDPRLTATAGSYSFTTIQREMTFDLGVLGRFLPQSSMFNGYAAVGPRLYLLQTVTSGKSGGENFGTNREQSTKAGVYTAVGGEMILGPGRVMLQMAFAYSPLGHEITGDISTSSLMISAGYRFVF
jgi:hypothetical protein